MKLLGILLYLLSFLYAVYVGLESIIIDSRNPLPKFTNCNEKSINKVPIIKTRKIVYSDNFD